MFSLFDLLFRQPYFPVRGCTTVLEGFSFTRLFIFPKSLCFRFFSSVSGFWFYVLGALLGCYPFLSDGLQFVYRVGQGLWRYRVVY